MRVKIVSSLVMALAISAISVVPAAATPGNGTVVTKGLACEVDASSIGLGTLVAEHSRWVMKRNGTVSKFKCRFRGEDMTGWDGTRRIGTADGLVCNTPAGVADSARLKINGRGNGWLKCKIQTPV